MKKEYGSFGARFLAHGIDSLLENVLPVGIGFGGLMAMGGNDFGGGLALFGLAFLLNIGLIFFNSCHLVSKKGYSLGKKAMSLRIEDDSGMNLSYGRAVIRTVVKRVCFFFSLLGVLIYIYPILSDKQKRSIGDMAAKSYVVSRYGNP